MVKNSTYFYLGGFISLTLFISFLSLFIYMMLSNSKQKIYALKKEKYISISIAIPTIEIKKDNKVIQKSKIKDTKIEPTIEKVKGKVVKNLNVKELFNDVWTKKIILKEKKIVRVEHKLINSKLLKAIEKKIEKLDITAKQPSSKNMENLRKEKELKKESVPSSANEVNEYLAKINALVYRYFHPPQNSEGHSVKAVIELSALGKVIDFRILNYSVNDALNEECDRIKERLLRIVFPLNPQNKSSRTIVILTSKE